MCGEERGWYCTGLVLRTRYARSVLMILLLWIRCDTFCTFSDIHQRFRILNFTFVCSKRHTLLRANIYLF